YLTVKATSGNPGPGGDRIVQVDPKTGALMRVIGATGSTDVLGLGYWGGIAYGFTLAGALIQIDLTTGAGTPSRFRALPRISPFTGPGQPRWPPSSSNECFTEAGSAGSGSGATNHATPLDEIREPCVGGLPTGGGRRRLRGRIAAG